MLESDLENKLVLANSPNDKRMRARLAEALLLQGSSAEPIKSWTQGAARLAQALMGGYDAGQLTAEEKADREQARNENRDERKNMTDALNRAIGIGPEKTGADPAVPPATGTVVNPAAPTPPATVTVAPGVTVPRATVAARLRDKPVAPATSANPARSASDEVADMLTAAERGPRYLQGPALERNMPERALRPGEQPPNIPPAVDSMPAFRSSAPGVATARQQSPISEAAGLVSSIGSQALAPPAAPPVTAAPPPAPPVAPPTATPAQSTSPVPPHINQAIRALVNSGNPELQKQAIRLWEQYTAPPTYGFHKLEDGTVIQTNPKTGEAKVVMSGANKLNLVVIGEDAEGRKQYGVFDPSSGKVTPYTPPGEAPTAGTPGAMPPVPPGADPKEWRKEWTKKEYADRAGAAEKLRTGQIVLEDIDRAAKLAEGSWTTGLRGVVAAKIPGTPAFNLVKTLDTIKANIGFDKLSEMRKASPTGGALGSISDFENRQLQSTLGNLENSQDKAQFQYNLARLKKVYTAIVHGIRNPDGTVRALAPADVGDAPTADEKSDWQTTPGGTKYRVVK